jgi:hypothetical protein
MPTRTVGSFVDPGGLTQAGVAGRLLPNPSITDRARDRAQQATRTPRPDPGCARMFRSRAHYLRQAIAGAVWPKYTGAVPGEID